MKKWIKKLGKRAFLFLYNIERTCLPVKKNVILFESNVGRNYTGNPKAIYEEMVKQGLDQKYQCIFSLENTNTPVPGAARKVKRLRLSYFYYMAVAKVWVSDSRLPEFIVKRKETKYIQTWHGTPLKKLALDLDSIHMDGESSLEEYKFKFKENSSTWDYLISQNKFSSNVFRRCFAFKKEMLETGYPRNDVLFQKNNEEDIRKLKEKFQIPLDKKVLLYAPTWRDNQFYGENQYKFTSDIDYDLMEKELSQEYVLLVKCHYLVKDRIDWSKYKGFIYSFDSECDIAELYLIADQMITDYSSVMFDYSLLKRPMLFFAYDLECYKDELRGFYFDYLGEIPGPVSQTTEELIRDIYHYQSKDYQEKYDLFTDKFNTFDDGKASKRIVERIEKLVQL